MDGTPIHSFEELKGIVAMSPGRPLAITVKRAGQALYAQGHAAAEAVKDRFGNVEKLGVMGVVNKLTPNEIVLVRYGFFGAVGEAGSQTWFVVKSTMTYLWRMVVGQQDASQLTGPVGIARVSEQVATLGFLALINLAALISVSIGLVNLFPVPILDGGHLLYYGFEAVLGRPLGARAQDVGISRGVGGHVGLNGARHLE